MNEPLLRVVSLGAGVQSSTMLLMGLRGEFGEKPDAAIFADTGWETKKVYDYFEWLKAAVAPFPVYVVSKGNIKESFYTAMSTGKRYVTLPAFVKNPDGSTGIGRRQCTKEYKIEPIQKQVRALMEEQGIKRRPAVIEQWIGISLDEIFRMKEARVQYIKHRWPLVEKRMTRDSCLNWMSDNGYPFPPKSSCIGCPFHSDRQWRDLKENDPEAWQEAVEFDEKIRDGGPRGVLIGQNYLHRSCQPLIQVDLSTAEEKGQLNLFLNECEGMCGV